MANVRRTAYLFRADAYPDKGVNATTSLLDRIIATTKAADEDPPFDLEHGPTERVLPFGKVIRSSLRRSNCSAPTGEHGEWIIGEVEVEEDVERHLTSRSLSVTLPKVTHDAICKVAVTATPRVRGAQFSEPEAGLAEFHGGYLMPETPVTTAPEAPAVDTQGLVAGIVAGVSGAIKGLFAKPAAEAEAEAQPAFSMADVEALLAKERAAFSEQNAATEKRAADAEAKANAQALAAFSAEQKARGVPPYMVEVLAPFAVGLPTAEVAFSADGKTETRAVAFAEAARLVLDSAAGAVPMARILPADDNREVSFSDKVAAKAAEYQKADPKLSKSAAMERAALEVTNG